MADGETSGLVGEVSLSVSLPVAEGVATEEMESDEHEESGHSDDDVDEDEINHSALPKGTVRANTPKGRAQKSDIWKHVKRIASHDSLHRGMNVECTHVCVYRLEDGGHGDHQQRPSPSPREKRLSPQSPVFSLQGLLQLPQDLYVQRFRVCKWA